MIGRTLGHYLIVEKIGAGGMGEVYRARDEHLERDVAIKVLPSGTLSDEAVRRRFRKEAMALSKLNHPNIATIFDFDTQDGVDFLVMELVVGESLSKKLDGRRLPENEVLRIGAQMAEGLAAAHEQSVIHRDLKPGNLRLSLGGRLKILDFGLAKLLEPVSDQTATESHSQTHAVVGTLPYMAPEQLRGEPADARTDIYAAGVVLFEMVTGRRPFQETLSTALTDAILHKPAPPPGRLHAELSADLERIILKCLEKDAENRYQSAKELLVDLRRLSAPTTILVPSPQAAAWGKPRQLWLGVAAIAVVGMLAVLFGANLGGLRDRLLGSPATPKIESLAVLPLENLSRDPEQEYFADGMTEALITELSKISALKVISRTSVMRYKNTDKPMPQIARELGVDGVVEGSVQREGDQVRITVQLIHGPTDRHLWAENYQRELRGILALQGEVAGAIAREIRVAVTPEEQKRLAYARAVHPDAYQAYLKGRYHWNRRTGKDLVKATEYFRTATDLDPGYALAYAGLADSYALYSWYDVLPARESIPQARAAAAKALELDGTLVEAHAARALITMYYDWDWAAAETHLQHLLETNPRYAVARQWYAEYLALMGRHEAAVAEIHRAQELDPLSPIMKVMEGHFCILAGRPDQAIIVIEKTLALEPDFPAAHINLGYAYTMKGMYKEATAAFRRAGELTGESIDSSLGLAYIYARSGRRREAKKALDDLLRTHPEAERLRPSTVAGIYAALGERDAAMAWLEKAYQERDPRLSRARVYPLFDPLRSDARFQDLLRRMNFPEN